MATTFVQGTNVTLVFNVTTDMGFIDLTGAEVTLYLKRAKVDTIKLPCLIQDAMSGKCVVGLQPNDLLVSGTYEYQLEVIKDGATVKNSIGNFYVSEALTETTTITV